ncbi:unnamed protein product [Symbiodinium natans]|uniref:Uncharacterized protein n=1 Tax=Symbiodinium natans TaxID=878477 RepID=A0A812LQ83_9DINO|nr:unnamed protein product [Symbiodinium natans]
MNASEVVPLTHGVQLYLLDRTDSGASFQAQCLVILARAGGFLLGVPVDTFSTAELKRGQSASPDELIGPSTEVTAGALAQTESGAETQLGRQVSVTLVDVREQAAALLLPMDLEEEPEFLHTFDMDAPEALPVFQELIDAARAWIAARDAQERVLFYSARRGSHLLIQPRRRDPQQPCCLGRYRFWSPSCRPSLPSSSPWLRAKPQWRRFWQSALKPQCLRPRLRSSLHCTSLHSTSLHSTCLCLHLGA